LSIFRKTMTVSVGAALLASGSVLLSGGTAIASPTTNIKLKVSGCDGCVFIAHYGKKAANGWRVTGTSTPVSRGTAKITVPRKKTKGLMFEVKHPAGYGTGGAVAFVKMSNRKSGICWNKKLKKRHKFGVKVHTKPGTFENGTPTSVINAWRDGAGKPRRAIGINGWPSCNGR
jgi:hypothetical protein